jgi:aryl-alcohol dehydrogenase-like predicted oxidoreductase
MDRLCRPLEETDSTTRAQANKNTVFDKPLSEADKTIIRRVEELAKKKGWTMTQVALAWINMKVSSPIVGMSKVERVEENIITGMVLDAKEVEYLEEPYEPKRVRGHL